MNIITTIKPMRQMRPFITASKCADETREATESMTKSSMSGVSNSHPLPLRDEWLDSMAQLRAENRA
jgi:hypothetical protein